MRTAQNSAGEDCFSSDYEEDIAQVSWCNFGNESREFSVMVIKETREICPQQFDGNSFSCFNLSIADF